MDRPDVVVQSDPTSPPGIVTFRRCPECGVLALPFADGRLWRCSACGSEPVTDRIRRIRRTLTDIGDDLAETRRNVCDAQAILDAASEDLDRAGEGQ